MTCQTDDPEREAAYLAVRPRDRAEAQAGPERASGASTSTRPTAPPCPRTATPSSTAPQENRRALYREANIPRETELAELGQQYQKIDRRHDRHLPGPGDTPCAQMAPFLEEPDRDVRQEAWELVAAPPAPGPGHARRPLRPHAAAPRGEIASEAGFDDLRRLRLPPAASGSTTAPARPTRSRTPSRRVVVPLARRLHEQRRATTGRRVAPPLGPGRRPAGPAAAPAVRRRRPARRRDRADLRRGRPGPRRPVRLPRASTACSTWPTARARPPAATRPPWRTTACRSSS